VNAYDCTIRADGVDGRFGVGVGESLQFVYQASSGALRVRDGVFAAKRGLVDEFIDILGAHERVAGLMIGKDGLENHFNLYKISPALGK
jgi:hypothetical protein